MKNLFQVFLVITFISINLFAQPGTLDPSFNPGSGFEYQGFSFDAVYSISVQSDGKIIVGGDFDSYNGTARNHIARLNADGSVDATFNPGTGANSTVYKTALQSDGKIIIGGGFGTYNGTARNSIARLNADGSLDTTFNPGSGFNASVFSISVQSDGKIIVGGLFTSFNGTGRNYITRLNADGSLDATFNTGTGFNATVSSTNIQTDGKIIVGGWFLNYNGTPRGRIARLNIDGSIDSTFDPGAGTAGSLGFDDYINATSIQVDGKIIVGGGFTSYYGPPWIQRSGIARLNTDGSLDATFNPGFGFDGAVQSTSIQADGKIIVGGYFVSFNGTGRNRIARLNTEGSLDASFNYVSGFNFSVNSIQNQADGKIIVGGNFTSFNGTGRNRIARLYGDNNVSGQVYLDLNESCLPDSTETGLAGRNLIINQEI